jgi:tRNA(fMet)-specific endonuclease VapC
MEKAILDTDTVSEILKGKNPRVIDRAEEYLTIHGQFSFSDFTRFEITRGLKAKGAITQLARFDGFCENCAVLPVRPEILDLASDLWAQARINGLPAGDADLIIAATALFNRMILVTGNSSHFRWIPGLTTLDWRSGPTS